MGKATCHLPEGHTWGKEAILDGPPWFNLQKTPDPAVIWLPLQRPQAEVRRGARQFRLEGTQCFKVLKFWGALLQSNS